MDDNEDQTNQPPQLPADQQPSLARRALRTIKSAVPIVAAIGLGAALSAVTRRK